MSASANAHNALTTARKVGMRVRVPATRFHQVLMNTANASVPLQPFVSGQLLYLPTNGQSGLILQYHHYAGFAEAGAAVGGCLDIICLDIKSKSVYTIGNVRFEMPATYQQRQQAFKRCIAYTQTLCKISAVHAPL